MLFSTSSSSPMFTSVGSQLQVSLRGGTIAALRCHTVDTFSVNSFIALGSRTEAINASNETALAACPVKVENCCRADITHLSHAVNSSPLHFGSAACVCGFGWHPIKIVLEINKYDRQSAT